jgi:hypothetical protein
VSAVAPPSDQELQAWLDGHPDTFRLEPAIAFSQIYFSSSRRGESASAAASKALAQLSGAGRPTAALELGDATMLPDELPLSRPDEVASVFGDGFAQGLARIEPGRWSGPLQSAYGWHLVYVSERAEGRRRPLAEVRDAVQREWLASRRREVAEATYKKLREKYAIVVETARPPADVAPRAGGGANAAQRP